MKKKKTLLITSIAFLATATLLISYSLFLIIGSQIRANERMNEWDALVAQQEGESSIVSSVSQTSKQTVSEISAKPTPTQAVLPKTVYKHELFGLIIFPTLDNRKVVVVNGITNKDLRGAAGHSKNSVLPGEIGNCIVFGHRDGVFRGFKRLKIEDPIIFKTLQKECSYKIISMTVEKPKAELIHMRYLDRSILTLVTCYPFNYIGVAPNRYVVVLELIK